MFPKSLCGLNGRSLFIFLLLQQIIILGHKKISLFKICVQKTVVGEGNRHSIGKENLK